MQRTILTLLEQTQANSRTTTTWDYENQPSPACQPFEADPPISANGARRLSATSTSNSYDFDFDGGAVSRAKLM